MHTNLTFSVEVFIYLNQVNFCTVKYKKFYIVTKPIFTNLIFYELYTYLYIWQLFTVGHKHGCCRRRVHAVLQVGSVRRRSRISWCPSRTHLLQERFVSMSLFLQTILWLLQKFVWSVWANTKWLNLKCFWWTNTLKFTLLLFSSIS